MIRLLDVNVLIALTWPNYVHHEAAQSWFTNARTIEWATCSLTEAVFVCISCCPIPLNWTTPLQTVSKGSLAPSPVWTVYPPD